MRGSPETWLQKLLMQSPRFGMKIDSLLWIWSLVDWQVLTLVGILPFFHDHFHFSTDLRCDEQKGECVWEIRKNFYKILLCYHTEHRRLLKDDHKSVNLDNFMNKTFETLHAKFAFCHLPWIRFFSFMNNFVMPTFLVKIDHNWVLLKNTTQRSFLGKNCLRDNEAIALFKNGKTVTKLVVHKHICMTTQSRDKLFLIINNNWPFLKLFLVLQLSDLIDFFCKDYSLVWLGITFLFLQSWGLEESTTVQGWKRQDNFCGVAWLMRIILFSFTIAINPLRFVHTAKIFAVSKEINNLLSS